MDKQGTVSYNGQPSLQDACSDHSVPPRGCSCADPVRVPAQPLPVQNQPCAPAGVPWVPLPPPAGCPPGLECLSQVDKIQIHQQIDLLEVLIHIGTNNKYEIKNSLGQKIYVALEDSNLCTQNCCGPCRPFTLRILDLLGREVITLKRPYRCATCCCNFYQQEMRIYIPPGPPVGYVIQTRNPYLSEFMVQNEKREDVLKITGPCLVCSCCADVDFEIKSLDEENVVGKISKQWTGFVREVFTDYTQFDVSFLVDVDVKMKAVILGACFLIDFMFFENKSCPYIFCTFLQINPC
ncbi:phospholipid scramblase 1-like [Saccopteryx bilineata]|uniref:phospholipid scramblase 1-like n=1 Tax=Saccopteryx bilineata TaxID=59482 RepID=UPI00338DBE6B